MKIAYVFKDSVVVPVDDCLEEIDQFSNDYVNLKLLLPIIIFKLIFLTGLFHKLEKSRILTGGTTATTLK